MSFTHYIGYYYEHINNRAIDIHSMQMYFEESLLGYRSAQLCCLGLSLTDESSFKRFLFSSQLLQCRIRLLDAKMSLRSLARNQLKLNLIMLLVSFTRRAREIFHAIHYKKINSELKRQILYC